MILRQYYDGVSSLNEANHLLSAGLIRIVDKSSSGLVMERACEQLSRNTVSVDAFQALEFEFIVSNLSPEAARTDQNTCRTIRRHAMRHHVRRTKLLSVSDSAITQTNKSILPHEEGTVRRFKLPSWSRKSSKEKKKLKPESPLHATPSIGRLAELGAINVLPIDLQLHTHKLLWHCKDSDIDSCRSLSESRLTFICLGRPPRLHTEFLCRQPRGQLVRLCRHRCRGSACHTVISRLALRLLTSFSDVA